MLSQNYPNPFNPSTTISYSIALASSVRLVVYDVLGREVATLISAKQAAGNYRVNFNASNLSSGVYFYRLQSGANVQTRKMLLVK
ncbi:MAG: T9SS type A sorting domain-containing protein [Rhizobacter sp.]|nr:T9SS type A sorting domain-containing protein [Chlorobiales bacterium]